MKDKILNVIMGISILALIGAGYREYLIHNGKLTSDLNANGYSITNLPAGFFPAETDPTVPSWAKEEAPPLPPGFAAVSNAAMTVGAAATNYTDAAVGQVSSDVDAASRAAKNYTDSATNAAQTAAITAANAYTDAAVADIPEVDMSAVTNIAQEAASAAQERAVADAADYTDRATNGLLRAESDPTVPAWAKAASAPLPPNYATVSNRAMSALQSYTETDPRFSEWADAHLINGGAMVDWASDAMYAQKLGGGFFTNYSADDITAISNGFAAADASLASRLSLASLAATNYTDSAISAAITNTNPTFSDAVLSVGLGIDTNTVAAINALVAAGDQLPIGGAATVGGLLLALAAAVAALKRTKADASALRYAFAATIQPTAGTAAPTGTLTDRAGNKVVCTEATGQTGDNAKLTLTLPPAVSGYMRDFLVKIDRTTSGCYSVDFVPYGNESVSYETEDGSMPEVPDGKVTWLSFTENESGGVFTVRATPLVAVTGGS